MVCEVTVGRFVYISFSAVADNLQFATENVNLKPLACILLRFGQPNIKVYPALDVGPDVTKAGTD